MKNLSLIIILGSTIIGLSLLLVMAHMDALDYEKSVIKLQETIDYQQKVIDSIIDEYDIHTYTLPDSCMGGRGPRHQCP